MTQATVDNVKQLFKDFGPPVVLLFSIFSAYFSLKAEIEVAKALPKPTISKEEQQYRDEIITKTILLTQRDVDAIKEDVREINESLKILEQRLYDKNSNGNK